ncbi:MAG: flagellar biosynthetic protein FliR [Paracoccus sp. (in: a-proteobacteria)]|nr:flagellar biosynthetic protein FliR [Paracoccus sp. (in: a-proteobacteria)]
MLQEALGAFAQADWSLALVYARVQAFFLVLPGFGERILPVRLRVSFAIVLTPFLAGFTIPRAIPDAPLALLSGPGAEMVIGFMAGGLLRILVMALDVATTAIAATASLSQIMGIQNEASPHPVGNMLHLGGLALLMALGFPVMLVQLLADSLLIWPPGSMPDAGYILDNGVRIVASSFWLAMMLAAPFTLGGFLYQALSGIINRVMPALPVVFIGAPGSILLALIALCVLAPLLVSIWAAQVLDFQLELPR